MVLVTGATGFVGRSVVHVLQAADRPQESYSGRINDRLALREALEDADAVIHLAGAEARDRVRLLQQVDVEGTERLLNECRRAQVDRVIVLSRLNADPASMHALLRSKGEAERLVRQSGLPYTIVRSATLFGRHDRFLNVITGLAYWTWPTVWLPGGGKVAMQPLWVEDLVRCLVVCLDRPDLAGQTIELAGEERLRYREIARRALNTAGIRRFALGVTPKLVRPISAVCFGWLRRPPVTRFFMDRFTVPEVAPIDSVYRVFRFHPGRMSQHTSYLRDPGLRWRLMRRP
ncbi:MAG: NAD(P)H-binding protein [Chloroflexota bacterium]|nr:MAG: NAD(P)H-binding protein [Chloroflexota bacterium]